MIQFYLPAMGEIVKAKRKDEVKVKTKFFISQPMNGLSDGAITAERQRIKLWIQANYGDDVEILKSFFNDFNGTPVQFLAKSIMLLGEADVVIFAPGWEKARGCKIEHDICVQYGLAIKEI